VQLQTLSPINDVHQFLNWSIKKESFPVKILGDFYFFDIAEYECDKKNCFFTHKILGEEFKFKSYFCSNGVSCCF